MSPSKYKNNSTPNPNSKSGGEEPANPERKASNPHTPSAETGKNYTLRTPNLHEISTAMSEICMGVSQNRDSIALKDLDLSTGYQRKLRSL